MELLRQALVDANVVVMGTILLGFLGLLLCGGVWIAMSLAIVGWAGLALFATTPPGPNLFTAFWSSTAQWSWQRYRSSSGWAKFSFVPDYQNRCSADWPPGSAVFQGA